MTPPPPLRDRSTSGRRLRLAAIAAALVLLAVLSASALHRITDIVRGSPIERVQRGGDPTRTGNGLPMPGSADFVDLVAAHAGFDAHAGNRVTLALDAALFEAMLRDIEAAERSISLLTYFCRPGRLVDRLAVALAERAVAGVEVRVLADAFGCASAIPSFEQALDGSGAEVHALRPLRWWSLHRAQHRHHGRVVVVDGQVGYTGGFGLDDAWSATPPSGRTWRETNVRVEGPVVRDLQASFAAAWAEATGTLLTHEALFPPLPRADGRADGSAGGPVRAGFLDSGPGLGTRAAERQLVLSIEAARETLFLTNSYFVPPPQIRRLLIAAAARGVDVRVLAPGPIIDVPSTRRAARSYYRELLEGGVRIWEYQPAMMHAKTLVVDGVWVSVGSMNLDNRSMRLNQESTLLAQDATLGAAMEALFRSDLERSLEVTLESHARRPTFQRLLEQLTRLAAPLL